MVHDPKLSADAVPSTGLVRCTALKGQTDPANRPEPDSAAPNPLATKFRRVGTFGTVSDSQFELENPRCGMMMLPLMLLLSVLVLAGLSLCFWQNRLNASLQRLTELDACTANQARLLSSSLNQLDSLNVQIQVTRSALQLAIASAQIELIPGLRATLSVLAARRTWIDSHWRAKHAQWQAQLICPGAIHLPMKPLPWLRTPPDATGPTPWLWTAPPSLQFCIQLDQLLYHHPGGHRAIVSKSGKWKASWTSAC